ncbi:Diphthamide biosynthesis protein 4 [Kalmusia sp. IMI 367209]|nr:Diphthamide biosynthesis protein 4 [Kalmusia sp. IMI 367209]
MVFTKDYYAILNLAPPSSSSSPSPADPPLQDALRKAYKAALLSAHPDKSSTRAQQQQQQQPGPDYAYTVDDVKEALAVLSDPGRRAEYERWWVLREEGKRMRDGGGDGGGGDGGLGTDFVLGLEALDLSDFEAGVMPFGRLASEPGSPSSVVDEKEEEEEEEEGRGELQGGVEDGGEGREGDAG